MPNEHVQRVVPARGVICLSNWLYLSVFVWGYLSKNILPCLLILLNRFFLLHLSYCIIWNSFIKLLCNSFNFYNLRMNCNSPTHWLLIFYRHFFCFCQIETIFLTIILGLLNINLSRSLLIGSFQNSYYQQQPYK